ncbi:flagellin N-terminal helical domain-containing protein [Pseudoduganella sp. OTU4001]|uniref:flagellin N-terminal helical domain-containing protein n=1 Tax=Pseudoduganella sp. OTU4001 TaxID=3043854 RepID=UPI00313CE942
MRINTNIDALRAALNMQRHGDAIAKSMQRLSSGLRINSAADDAAGLAIADRMTAQLRGMRAARSNISDGASMAQVADGALASVMESYQRIRELAVQAASDTYSPGDRMAMQLEASALLLEIKRIAEDTNFNGIRLLDGGAVIQLQLGADDGDTLPLAVPAVWSQEAGDISLLNHASATAALQQLDARMAGIANMRGMLGAAQNRLGYAASHSLMMEENLAAARSRIMDVDYAAETARLARHQILQQAAIAMLTQATAAPRLVLQLLR